MLSISILNISENTILKRLIALFIFETQNFSAFLSYAFLFHFDIISKIVGMSGGNTKICGNRCWDFLSLKLLCVRLPTIENIFG